MGRDGGSISQTGIQRRTCHAWPRACVTRHATPQIRGRSKNRGLIDCVAIHHHYYYWCVIIQYVIFVNESKMQSNNVTTECVGFFLQIYRYLSWWDMPGTPHSGQVSHAPSQVIGNIDNATWHKRQHLILEHSPIKDSLLKNTLTFYAVWFINITTRAINFMLFFLMINDSLICHLLPGVIMMGKPVKVPRSQHALCQGVDGGPNWMANLSTTN